MILICDDDTTIRSSLTLVLKRAGYAVTAISSPEEAIDFVRRSCPELVLMDMNYSKSTTGEEGLELLSKVKIFCPEVPVILITAWGSIDLAVRGIRAGAFDFVTKPWNNLTLLNTIRTAIELNREPAGVPVNPRPASGVSGKIIGKSPQLKQVLETVSRIAPTDAAVLITGESGTGKELIAEAIHENSRRKNEPFVKVNLGGISQSLFESEMFGHKKGAFTDAHYDRVGRFEMADRGTIFLDEIGELDPVSQVKLLRVLQDQTFEPLGESRPKQINTRVVSATNRDLAAMVSGGTFRADLFYRINLIMVRIPALRERIEDIPLLTDHFLSAAANNVQAVRATVTPEAIRYLQRLPWPGNIRELKNLVERTLLVSGKEVLDEADFKAQYTEISSPGASAVSKPVRSLDELEKNTILQTVELYGGNHSKIAMALGLSRQALYRRMEKYGINTNETGEE